MEENTKKNIFAEWLEKLQQESWQLELLISGFALFGIWESQGMLNNFGHYVSVNAPSSGASESVLMIFLYTLLAAWVIFFINLLFHVILRGLWIGAIGLRYVSGDIDYDSLDFSDEFNKYFKKRVGRFDDYIERLEKVCSVIFAYTFLLFFIFLSCSIFIIICVLLANTLEYLLGDQDKDIVVILILIFVFFGFIVFLDFITLGALKKVRNEKFARAYSYLYRFFSFITLSFIYRPLLYNFIDYKYTRRLFWFSIPYILAITLVIPNFFLEGTPHFPSFEPWDDEFEDFSKYYVSKRLYDDERNLENGGKWADRNQIRTISLSSREFSESHGKLFLRQKKSDEKLLTEKYGITSYRTSGLSHRIFGNNNKDSLMQHLEKQKSTAVLKMIRARKAEKEASGEVDTITSESTSPFMAGYELEARGKVSNPGNYWDQQIDSTRTYWQHKMRAAEEDKLVKIMEALKKVNQLSINGNSINNKLSCKFYKHPNLDEKGLLCYFPLDSLSPGEHVLKLDRSIYNTRFKDSLDHFIVNIPFWKITKE